jgi:hypothetical protein
VAEPRKQLANASVDHLLSDNHFGFLILCAGLSAAVIHPDSPLRQVYNCRRPANEAFLYGWLANRIGEP